MYNQQNFGGNFQGHGNQPHPNDRYTPQPYDDQRYQHDRRDTHNNRGNFDRRDTFNDRGGFDRNDPRYPPYDPRDNYDRNDPKYPPYDPRNNYDPRYPPYDPRDNYDRNDPRYPPYDPRDNYDPRYPPYNQRDPNNSPPFLGGNERFRESFQSHGSPHNFQDNWQNRGREGFGSPQNFNVQFQPNNTRNAHNQFSSGKRLTTKELQQLLEDVADRLKKNHQKSVIQILRAQPGFGTYVIDKETFINFLQSQWMQLNIQMAYELFFAYALIVEPNMNYRGNPQDMVDVLKFESEIQTIIFQDEREREEFLKQFKDPKKIEQMYSDLKIAVEKFERTQGKSLYDIFEMFDKDHSLSLDLKEFISGLEKIGTGFSIEEFEFLFMSLDVDKSGTIRYREFFDTIQHHFQKGAFDDRNHWLFLIFEHIRRSYFKINKSMQVIFKAPEPKKGESLVVAWKTFLFTLSDVFQQTFDEQEQHELKAFVESPTKKDFVDLNEFQQLLGLTEYKKMEKEAAFFQDKQSAYVQKNKGKITFEETRGAILQVVERLVTQSLKEQNIRDELFPRNQVNAIKDHTDLKNFKEHLQVLCTKNYKHKNARKLENIPETVLNIVAGICANKDKPDLINYEEFIVLYQSQWTLLHALQFLFFNLGTIMKRNQYTVLSEVIIKNGGVLATSKTFNKDQFKECLKKLNLNLHDFEVDQIMKHFDLSGKGINADLAELNKEYARMTDYQYQQDVFGHLDGIPARPSEIQQYKKITDEEVLEKLIKAFNGDDSYIKSEGEKLDIQKVKAIAPNQFAMSLIGADPKLTQIQIEHCLIKFGQDKFQKTLVNIQDFVDSFAKKRDALKITKGVFKSSIGIAVHKPLGAGVIPTPQRHASLDEKEQILQNIRSRIQERCKVNKIDLQKIFADAELKERGIKDGKAYKFTGYIKKAEFNNLLTKNQIEIYQTEIPILEGKYLSHDKNFPLSINYQEFVTDVLQEGNAAGKLKLNLTAEQQQVLTNIQRIMNKDAATLPLFAKELKLLDTRNSNYVDANKVIDCFKNVKMATITQKLVDSMLSCIKIEKGAVKIHEILQLINDKDADDLFNANIRQLENGTWKKQSSMKKQYNAGAQKFEMPKQTVSPADKFAGSVGTKLIQTNVNYEAAFFEAMSEPKNIAHPLITYKEFIACIGKLKINLMPEEKRQVEGYFKDLQDSSTEKVNLADLLKYFGLPPQTLGERAAKLMAKKVDFILSDKELKSIHNLIMKIKRECERLKLKADKLIEDSKVKKDDLTIDPTRLLKVLQDAFKKDFVKNLAIEENMDNFILYTSENVGDKVISVKKLLIALQKTEKDEPLKQSGVDDIKDYERGIKAKLEMSAGQQELNDFLEYMKKNNKFLNDIVPSNSKAMSIPEGEFKKSLARIGYTPNDFDNFVQVLATTVEVKGHHNISIAKLKEALTKGKQTKQTAETAKNRIQNMPPDIRKALDQIQNYIKTKQMTVDELHKKLDTDGDGKVTKKEFIKEMTNLKIPEIVPTEIAKIFDKLDVNQDGSLTVGEFSMYLKGVELTREAKIKKLDQRILTEINEDVVKLFKIFDEDGNGKLEAQEIFMTLQSFGVKKSQADCEQLIRNVTKGLSTLDQSQFIALIQPMMLDQLLNQNQQVQDLRKLFIEADVDGSGMLSVEELYAALKKLGAEVQIDDIVSLMAQIDVDRDGELDIDEFVSLMTTGDHLQEIDNDGKNTLMKINKARRVDPLEFLKIFKNMPQNFVPSFVKENWQSENLLPSQVFKAQVDPKTMLWKDVRDVRSDHDLKTFENKQGHRPYLRPIETIAGCKLILKEATGVPLPKVDSKSTFKDDHIVKRVVRIGFASSTKEKKEFLHHVVQVPAQWSKDNEDIWKFTEKQMSEVLFRTTKQDQLVVGDNTSIIFELCVYVKQNEQSHEVTEMSCGWCELDIKDISRGFTAQLPIKGGSPEAEVQINDNEVRAERSGFSFIKKVVAGGKVEKCLEVQIQPFQKLELYEQTHMSLLPSTCFIQRQLLYFVSAFMNYKAHKLLLEAQSGIFKKPSGDVIISCFPKIFDCPDILEELTQVWMEDVEPELRKQNKILNIDYLIERMKDFINRLYPILYSEAFRYNELNGWYQSLCGSDKNLIERKKLVRVALRNAQVHQVAKKENESVDSLTQFTPFSVRELEFEVWDTRKTKQDQFLSKFK